MKIRPLIAALVLLALAFSVARALASRPGVGLLELAVGIALVGVLAFGTAHFGRRALGRA
jgi:hypothetical protein